MYYENVYNYENMYNYENILKQTDDVNRRDEFGQTKLFSAVVSGDVETVKRLLKHPMVDVDICDDDGNTPIHRICVQSDFEEEITDEHMVCAKLWLDATSRPGDRNRNGYDALFYACEDNHMKIVKLLLEKPYIDVNRHDEDNEHPLFSSAADNYDMFKLLLELGADHNIVYDRGLTTLMNACEWGSIEVVKLLLELGADINIVDDYNKTALMYACERGHIKIVKLLLEHGADVNIKDETGCDALSITLDNENADITNLIKNHIKNKKMDVLKVIYKGQTYNNKPLLHVAKSDMARIIAEFVV